MSAESFVHTLKVPVTMTRKPVDGEAQEETITSVTLRSPITKDLRVTDGIEGEVAKTIALVAHLSGLPVAVIDKMSPSDFTALGALVSDF